MRLITGMQVGSIFAINNYEKISLSCNGFLPLCYCMDEFCGLEFVAFFAL